MALIPMRLRTPESDILLLTHYMSCSHQILIGWLELGVQMILECVTTLGKHLMLFGFLLSSLKPREEGVWF